MKGNNISLKHKLTALSKLETTAANNIYV